MVRALVSKHLYSGKKCVSPEIAMEGILATLLIN